MWEENVIATRRHISSGKWESQHHKMKWRERKEMAEH